MTHKTPCLAFIFAMQEEMQAIKIAGQESTLVHQQAGLDFHLFGENTYAVVSGIGKVNAALATQIVIDRFQPDLIVNLGVAGLIDEQLLAPNTPLSQLLIIGTELVQHDVDVTAFGDPPGQIPRLDVLSFPADKELVNNVSKLASSCGLKPVCGIIASGDQFIAHPAKKKFIQDNFQALACEMEGAAIAQVAYLNETPFLVLRTISDLGTENATHDYEKQKEEAVYSYRVFLQKLIKALC